MREPAGHSARPAHLAYGRHGALEHDAMEGLEAVPRDRGFERLREDADRPEGVAVIGRPQERLAPAADGVAVGRVALTPSLPMPAVIRAQLERERPRRL